MALDLTYVAGPMSSIGPPDWNYPAFDAMAWRLRTAGFPVVNPAELTEADPNVPWDFYLRRDIPELVKCSRIVLLEDWEASKGARLERHIAEELGMEIVLWHQVDDLIGVAA